MNLQVIASPAGDIRRVSRGVLERREATRACARLRAPVSERGDTALRTWRILRKLRCWPWRAGPLAGAVDVSPAAGHEQDR